MRHPNRLDLPKGHVEDGESEHDCALRELREETGIAPEALRLEPGFRYEATYYPRERRYGGEPVEKTLVIFLGWIQGDPRVETTEHAGFEWRMWSPPHRIQRKTIDPLLRAVERHFAGRRRREQNLEASGGRH